MTSRIVLPSRPSDPTHELPERTKAALKELQALNIDPYSPYDSYAFFEGLAALCGIELSELKVNYAPIDPKRTHAEFLNAHFPNLLHGQIAIKLTQSDGISSPLQSMLVSLKKESSHTNIIILCVAVLSLSYDLLLEVKSQCFEQARLNAGKVQNESYLAEKIFASFISAYKYYISLYELATGNIRKYYTGSTELDIKRSLRILDIVANTTRPSFTRLKSKELDDQTFSILNIADLRATVLKLVLEGDLKTAEIIIAYCRRHSMEP